MRALNAQLAYSASRHGAPQLSRRHLVAGVGAGLTLTPGLAMGQDLGDVLGALLGQQRRPPGSGLLNGVTGAEAEGGLKEALINGAIASATRLGQEDGYWGDNSVRIPLPGTLGSIQRRLDRFGMASVLNDLQLRLNRGAERAAPQSIEIFKGAITGMTVTDVVGVLRGGGTAGTDYLKQATGAQLTELYTPPVMDALDSSGAGQAFDRATTRYRLENSALGDALGLDSSTSLKEQFVGYAVEKGLDGLFYYVGEEEKAIRASPVKRTSDLLRRVFGAT